MVRGWPSPDRYQTSDRLHLGFPHGLRAIAIYTGSQLAYQGAVIQMIATACQRRVCLFSAVSFMNVSNPRHAHDGRSVEQDEMAASTSLFFAVATLGMPGTGNFVGDL